MPVLAFLLGIVCLQHLATLPPVGILLWLAIPTTLCLAYVWHKQVLQRYVLLCIAICLLGFIWADLRATWRMSDTLDSALELKPLTVIGTITGLPIMHNHKESFRFRIEQVLTPHTAHIPQNISLSRHITPTPLHVGERWQFTVVLKRPHGFINPRGQDTEQWALMNNIRAFGTLHARYPAYRIDSFVWEPSIVIEKMRESIQSYIMRTLGHADYRGIIAALVMGNGQAIRTQDWQVFSSTGTTHLMSISGLHISLFSGMVTALVIYLWKRTARLSAWLPSRRAGAICGLVTAWIYTLLAGFAIPAQRTLFMLLALMVALYLGSQWRAPRVLSVALFIVLILDPWSVLSIGFWLSFGIVAILIYAFSQRLAAPYWLTSWAQAQWVAGLGVMPLLLIFFSQIPLISPLANAVAIPIISLIVTPLAIFASFIHWDWGLVLAYDILGQCMAWLTELSHYTAWQWHLTQPPLWAVLCALLGLLWLLLPRGLPLRLLGLLAFLPIVWQHPIPQGAMTATVLDIGQGLSVLIQTRQHTLLYDTGRVTSAQKVIIPFLHSQGITRLNGVVLSHSDSDHTGGADEINHTMSPHWLMTSFPVSLPHIPHTYCVAGTTWQWDGVTFSLLSPTADTIAQDQISDNQKSCVLKIDSQQGSLLLTGDIPASVEKRLVDSLAPETLSSDVLVVPHHGSKSSSTPEFIRAVSPRASILSVGYLNAYHHPHPAIVARYHESLLYRTDLQGAIVLRFNPDGQIRIDAMREAKPHYWFESTFVRNSSPNA